MSRVKLTRRDRATPPVAEATVRKPVPQVAAGSSRRRSGDRLAPGDAALEREADAYAAGRVETTLRGPGKSPTGLRGGGRPLPQRQRAEHEALLGRDLSGLRIHAGAPARLETSQHGARAMADHGDVMFNAGEFRPGTGSGDRLLAHEVAHAVQHADRRGSGPALKKEPSLSPEVPAPAVVRSDRGAIAASVYFGQGDFLLDRSGAAALEGVRRLLSSMVTGARLAVDAHASGEGSASFNQELSERRRMAVIALLTHGLPIELDLAGAAHGEAIAAATESGATESGASDLEAQRSQDRRVDIVVVPNWVAAAQAPPARRAIDLTIPGLRPTRPRDDLGADFGPLPAEPERDSVSICSVWSDRTRTWFDRRLRELGIGETLRGALADLGVGMVERLAFTVVEDAVGAAGANAGDTAMIMATLRAACRQEIAR